MSVGIELMPVSSSSACDSASRSISLRTKMQYISAAFSSKDLLSSTMRMNVLLMIEV